jgi:hypothetical protein
MGCPMASPTAHEPQGLSKLATPNNSSACKDDDGRTVFHTLPYEVLQRIAFVTRIRLPEFEIQPDGTVLDFATRRTVKADANAPSIVDRQPTDLINALECLISVLEQRLNLA